MRRKHVRVALVLVAIAVTALGAQHPRDNRAPGPEGTALLAGRVVTRDAGARPLRKVIVTLRSDDGRQHRTIITDDGGTFGFAGLPSGRYALEASRRGWPTIAFGAARPHQRGTRVEVAEGQRVDGLTIRMPRGAVLAGSVVDHTGRALAHASVLALRYTYIGGERRLTRYRQDQTDDRGIYRLYGLAAGEYLVAVAGAPTAFEDAGIIHANGEADVRMIMEIERAGYARPKQDLFVAPTTVGYAPIFYPGTPIRTQATTVSLSAGEERSGLDFEVAPAQALAVQGLVDRPRGLPPAVGVRLSLRTAGDEAAIGYVGDERTTAATPGGAFTFANVPPGTYELSAHVAQEGTTTHWASSALTVVGDHAPRMLLSLRPALTLSGRVAFEGDPADVSAVRLSLQRLPAEESVAASADESGEFVVNGLVPGRYRVAVSVGGRREARARTWSVKSFVVNGAEILEAPLDLRTSVAGALVTFTDRYGMLAGTVLDGAGRGAPEQFVVVFPADPRQWSPWSRRIQAVRPFSDGRYVVEHLAPGEYLLAVVADIEDGEWADRTLLQRLAGTALRFDVAEGQRVVKDLRVQ